MRITHPGRRRNNPSSIRVCSFRQDSINSSHIVVGPEFPLVNQGVGMNFTVRNVGANASNVILRVLDNNVTIQNLDFGKEASHDPHR